MSNKLSSMLSDIDTSVHSEASKTTLNEHSAISQDTPRIFPIYICINEYSQRMEDELNMKPGDKIQVITDDDEYNDGWYFGKNLRTKEEGLYPVVFTQVISTERKSTLMRAKSLKRLNSSSGNLTLDHNTSSSNGFQNGRTPSGSNSALATPQEMQTASIAPFSKFHDAVNTPEANTKANGRSDNRILEGDSEDHPLGRNVSVRSTMSDIDKAIEELSFEPTESLNILDSSINNSGRQSVPEDTIITGTEDLSVGEHTSRPGTALSYRSQSHDNVNELHEKGKYLNPSDVTHWTPEQVSSYFIDSGFDVESASRFKQHKISGAILLELELAHLKELDINSFGTRFEMYKEIESLKQQVNSKSTIQEENGPSGLKAAPAISKELMPPAQVDKDSPRDKKVSRSMVDLPSRQSSKSIPARTNGGSNNRPVSLMVNDQITKDIQDGTIILPIAEDLENENLFASPRRAPKPPSYPSPVQPPKSPMVNMRRNNTPMASSNLTYSPSSLYQKQSPASSKPQNNPQDDSFEGTVVNNLQIPKRENLGATCTTNDDVDNGDDEASTVSDRPTSSIYESSSMSSSHPPAESTVKEEIENKNLHLRETKHSGNKVKRNSSLLSYFSKGERSPSSNTVRKSNSFTVKKKNSFISSPVRQEFTEKATGSTPDANNGKAATISPVKKEKGRSVSAKDNTTTQIDMSKKILEDDKKKRSVSEAMKPKTLRAMTTRQPLRKQKTSAFQEGLRNVSVKDALKTADFSGWMSKKGSGTVSTWRTRFFILEGTRLSYFANTTDTKERGLIDVTGYRVVPAREDDKFVSLFAATAGKGRYCFKLLPPQPGSRKGVTFTEPRIHYFAVDSKEEMRGWIANLIKTTIDIDTTVPVISSYSTPTVSLSKAREMLAEAREETRAREQHRLLNKNSNDDEDDEGRKMWDEQHHDVSGDKSDPQHDTKSRITFTSTEDGTFSNLNTVTTAANTSIGSTGFASPYLLASGMLSPQVANKNGSPRGTPGLNKKSDEDYFGSHSSSAHVL